MMFAMTCTGTSGWAAQGAADGVSRIEEVTVMATRTRQPVGEVPMAVSVVEKSQIQRGRQQLGLDEALNRVPGVFSQNRYNFAQDLRLSIRGFGARANFGIRGLKIFADGIPATMADGQSGVDDIDLSSIERIEVTRGPSSSLYGASSGGVLNLYTEDGPATPFVETAVTVGEYDQQKYQLKAGGPAPRSKTTRGRLSPAT
jgi:iron complex outermembrane receptor protein